MCENLDRTRLAQLLVNMGGIYGMYFVSGILHESVYKHEYENWVTGTSEKCPDSMGILIVPFLVAWWMATIYNCFAQDEPVQIPRKNAVLTSFAIVVASAFSMFAILRTSFPVVIMFESCSIVPVVLIGVFCTRVRDEELRLDRKKIIVTVIIVIGILLFELFDPETWEREGKQEFIGFVFLLFHFIAEGFLPDLQAEIKVEFKPTPTQMMQVLNKWATLLSILLLLVTWQIYTFPIFLFQHPSFAVDLVGLSLLSGGGQFFVYRMIKQFKQHFVPFTISSRKILTVVISIIFYQHKSNWVQFVGVAIVLSAVGYEFLNEISKKTPVQKNLQLNEEMPNAKEGDKELSSEPDRNQKKLMSDNNFDEVDNNSNDRT